VKILGSVLVAILVLAAVFIGAVIMHASKARDVDQAFHANIPKTLFLRSISFTNNAEIPTSYTCKGEGASPEISWEGAPAGARSYAYIITDWDVPSPHLRLGNFTHFLLYDIVPEIREIKSAVTAAELTQQKIAVGLNSADVAGYAPLCPPRGRHLYVFRVYALDVPQLTPASRTRAAVMESMKGHVLAYGELVGFFGG
jgi:Raf kinase inhibitor-like YbhB/YbcL family protein